MLRVCPGPFLGNTAGAGPTGSRTVARLSIGQITALDSSSY